MTHHRHPLLYCPSNRRLLKQKSKLFIHFFCLQAKLYCENPYDFGIENNINIFHPLNYRDSRRLWYLLYVWTTRIPHILMADTKICRKARDVSYCAAWLIFMCLLHCLFQERQNHNYIEGVLVSGFLLIMHRMCALSCVEFLDITILEVFSVS